MANRLVTVAVLSTLIAAGSLTVAFALSRGEWPDLDDGLFNGTPRCETEDGAATATRDIPWNSDSVDISLPANTRYKRGSGDMLRVSGDPKIIAHVRVAGGEIELDCRRRGETTLLDITLPGGEFRSIALNGRGKLLLEDLSQRELDLRVQGSGTAEANGSVDILDLEIAGSGHADLNSLMVQRLDLNVAGSGTAEVAPQNEAEVDIAGSGKAYLSTGQANLRRLNIDISGSGQVEASGKASDIDLTIQGSGDARLSKLIAERTEVSIHGSGDADIAPTDRAKIDIMGSGDVRLFAEPKSIESNVAGSGRVEHVARETGTSLRE
jgi:hypothetical protein